MSSTPQNRLIHGYLGIDNDALWSIITGDIPTLHAQLLMLKRSLASEMNP